MKSGQRSAVSIQPNHGQRGFGAVMAIVVLVIMASMAAAMVKFGTTQQLTSAQDVLSAKAWGAARTGNEWGLYQALKNNSCTTTTLDLTADTGFRVTVVCSAVNRNEGESVPGTPNVLRVYRIESTACNIAASCPAGAATATSPGYIERKRQAIATDQ